MNGIKESNIIYIYTSLFQEGIAKSLLAEFNLGCRGSDLDHKYRIYVATFLGFGGNSARKRYEKTLLTNATTLLVSNDHDKLKGANHVKTGNDSLAPLTHSNNVNQPADSIINNNGPLPTYTAEYPLTS